MITELILDDIKITRLIQSLNEIQINANDYSLSNSKHVLNLMDLKCTERNLEVYHSAIEHAIDRMSAKLQKMPLERDAMVVKNKLMELAS